MEINVLPTVVCHERALRNAKVQDREKLTTGHIGASNATDWEGRLLVVVAHADSCAITLIKTIDEEVSESGVSVGEPSSSSCKKVDLDV